jgi:hypothetical protein
LVTCGLVRGVQDEVGHEAGGLLNKWAKIITRPSEGPILEGSAVGPSPSRGSEISMEGGDSQRPVGGEAALASLPATTLLATPLENAAQRRHGSTKIGLLNIHVRVRPLK